VNGVRRRPEPGLRGVCDLCGGAMVSRCGKVRIHHWAHLRKRNCDPWWENETEWHRNWKEKFPEPFREVTVVSDSGERHRADVKTGIGRVVEFQYSPIKLEDRTAREEFYGKMAWVVSGLRLKRDATNFGRALGDAIVVNSDPLRLKLWKGDCSILRDWSVASASVYLDFGETVFSAASFKFGRSVLWQLSPSEHNWEVLVTPIRRKTFIDAAMNGSPINGITTAVKVALAKRERKPLELKHSRRKGESHLEYGLRVWGIEDNDKED